MEARADDPVGRPAAVVLRAASADDAAAVAAVHTRSRAAYYGDALRGDDLDREPMWRRMLPDPDRYAQVATVGGEVVGFLSAGREGQGHWELTALYVLPELFGRGIGASLHAAFVVRIAGDPAELEVWDANVRAKEFYRRRGWVPTARTREGPGDRPFVRWRLTR